MIAWLDASEHQRFGESLAAFVAEKVPREAAKSSRKGSRKNSPHEVMRKLVQQVDEFRAKHPSNVYKKAKFGNAFKWKLREAGFDPVFADELTKELLIHFG
jgi:hypothetical protein